MSTTIEVKKAKLQESKLPERNSTDNYVGIEVEFFSPIEKMEKFSDFLIEHNVDEYVCVKNDGSIDPNRSRHRSCEINILIKETEYVDVLKRICNVLDLIDAKVNKSCGLHVHLDARNKQASKMYNNLVKAQDFLYSMCPLSRKENSYCKKITESNLVRASRKGRYYGINPESYSKYNTIECRIHSGTIEVDKMIHWITLLLKIADIDNTLKSFPKTLKEIKSKFDLEEKIYKYICERVSKFYPESSFLTKI